MSFLARLSIEMACFWPSRLLLFIMKGFNKIQLSVPQLKAITRSVKSTTSCGMLVFGLGNDSLYWSRLNKNGTTVFLENDEEWYEKIVNKSEGINASLINYDSKRSDWKELLERQSLLHMQLPSEVENEAWDTILVDGPPGWKDHHPGRMKSIFQASRIAGLSTDIFVHDCQRPVEDAYCNTFLKNDNLIAEIEGESGLLRHYKMANVSVAAENSPGDNSM